MVGAATLSRIPVDSEEFGACAVVDHIDPSPSAPPGSLRRLLEGVAVVAHEAGLPGVIVNVDSDDLPLVNAARLAGLPSRPHRRPLPTRGHHVTTAPPDNLVATVEAHGKAVAAADNEAVLADFMPDRIGQLIVAADVPNRLKGSQVRSITDAGNGRYDAVIRYTKPDDTWFELRSRWVPFEDGSWRVLSVRNIPDTPPWMDLTGPSPDGLDTPHWDGLRAGKLLLQRCHDCASWIWSPRPICPNCHCLRIALV